MAAMAAPSYTISVFLQAAVGKSKGRTQELTILDGLNGVLKPVSMPSRSFMPAGSYHKQQAERQRKQCTTAESPEHSPQLLMQL